MAEKLEWSHFLQTIADYAGVEKSELNEDTHIYNDLGLDSLGLFSIGMQLIKTYGIKIPLSATASIETVKDLYALLEERQGENLSKAE